MGLPYFALSATSPLVQVWFSRSYPGRSPYRLYALSNFGSLAALLSYPFVFEPAFTLPGQSWLWSAGFRALRGALRGWRGGHLAAAQSPADRGRGDAPAVADDRRPAAPLGGAGCAVAAAAGMRLADALGHHEPRLPGRGRRAAAVGRAAGAVPGFLHPLLRPPALVSSRRLGPCWRSSLIVLVSAMDFLHAWAGFSPNYLQDLLVSFGVLLAVCMVCHGELVRLRPEPRRLTEFYLLIAVGGVLGGVLVALVAPLVFHRFLEWPIGLVLSYVLAAIVLLLPRPRWAAPGSCGWWAARRLPSGWCASFAGRSIFPGRSSSEEFLRRPGRSRRLRQRPGPPSILARPRPRRRTAGNMVDPAKRRLPTSYYAEQSGVGRAFR